MRFYTLLCALLAVFIMPAQASEPVQEPVAIVQSLYDPYLAATDTTPLEAIPSAMELIYPHATVSLQQALERERTCQEREGGICTLDFDILINAQDWSLSDFSIKILEQDPARARIAAHFINGTANTLTFFFEKEQGKWKINDIEATRFTPENTVDYTVNLRDNLAR